MNNSDTNGFDVTWRFKPLLVKRSPLKRGL